VTDNRLENLMQEALDETLSFEQQRELAERLENDVDASEAFDQQQRVDDLLQRPPMERAPERLALTIMARIAEMAHQQQQQEGEINAFAEASLRVAAQLVTVATLPLLISASWMLVNAMANPKMLDDVLEKVVGLLLLMIDVMSVLMEKAEEVAADDPELALAILSMMPVVTLDLVEIALGKEE
jgi:hypothetical protein